MNVRLTIWGRTGSDAKSVPSASRRAPISVLEDME